MKEVKTAVADHIKIVSKRYLQFLPFFCFSLFLFSLFFLSVLSLSLPFFRSCLPHLPSVFWRNAIFDFTIFSHHFFLSHQHNHETLSDRIPGIFSPPSAILLFHPSPFFPLLPSLLTIFFSPSHITITFQPSSLGRSLFLSSLLSLFLPSLISLFLLFLLSHSSQVIA